MNSIQPVSSSLSSFEERETIWSVFLEKLNSPNLDEKLASEAEVQVDLNKGIQPPSWFLSELQKISYSISYHFDTVERFRTFSFPRNRDLEIAIRQASAKTGLLVDKNKMYRPGPASAKNCNGAAKGYDEIFALFEKQTTEKKRIAKDTCHFIASMEENLPKDHPWQVAQGTKILLDLGCGNGVQTQEIVSLYPCSVIGMDNQVGCIAQCQKLLPSQTFEIQDCFANPLPHFKQKADIIFVSHFYCPSEKVSLLIERIKEYQASENACIIFVNGCTGTDGDRIANKLPFLRGKPSSSMSDDFKKGLESQGYACIEKVRQARVIFPPLTAEIWHQLLTIQRGDYENPYPNMDLDVKTFKALMEFIASFPLESMTQKEITLYLNELEETFQANGGSYLKICNQMLFAHPKNADSSFRAAFKKAQDGKNLQFEQIRDKVESGFLEEAKDDLGNLLKDWEDKDLEKSIAGFQLMSEIFLQDEKYPEAAAILWYTKRLDKDQTSHLKIDTQLEMIERTLLQKATHQEGPLRGIAQATLDQEKLKRLRERIKEEYLPIQAIENHVERAQALRHLYQQSITKNLKTYIHELAQDVIKQMEAWGKSTPCEYALIGFGSLAREEMTPYSDFEFAILIDSEKEEDKEYFRIFTRLLHLRFINLGETILPSLDIRYLRWVFDTMTPRGLSFDGNMPKACKTPLGRKGYYELIHTPEGLSRLQFIDAEESNQKQILQSYHLPSILSACTYVTGSKEGMNLVSNYQNKVQKILQKEGKKRAADLMKDDLNSFTPHLEDEESGKHYHVKKDLYRLPNTMFDGLANYFCLQANSTWERIEELEEKGLFTSKGAQDLKELIMLSQELRLLTYFHHGCQKDHLDIETQKINLKELYYRLLPFVTSTELFCTEMTKKQGQPEVYLKKEQFYQDSLFHQGIIAFRHMDYLEAERCLTLEVIDTLQYYELLGAVKNTLGKYEKAEEAYRKAIEKQASCHLYMKLGEVCQSLGRYKNEKSAEEVFLQAKDLAEKSSDQILLERIYRHLTSLYKECGDYDSMRAHLRLCKEQSQKRTSTKEKDAEYGVVLDLDLAKTKELEAKILHDLDSQFEESGKLFNEAYRIFEGYYRRWDHPAILNYKGREMNVKTLFDRQNLLSEKRKKLEIKIKIFGKMHPDVAISYGDIGSTLNYLGKYEKALQHQRKVLQIDRKIFGEVHPNVAIAYGNMGSTLGYLGKYKEALENQRKALEIQCKIFGEMHYNVAAFYNNVGSTLAYLGKHEEALKNQRKALEIQQCKIFSGIHPNIAVSYNNVGVTFANLGKYKEALENQRKALEMQRKIFEEIHPDVAASYGHIGSALASLGKYEKALKNQRKALEIQRKIFGEIHSNVAASYDNVGFTLGHLGKYEETLENQRKALEIRRKVFGKMHPDMAASYNHVGSTLVKIGKYEEALKNQRKALEMRRKIFGEIHSDVATSYDSVGSTFGYLGKHDEALKNQRKALEMRRKIFGKMHPDMAASYNNVGSTLDHLGKYEEALKNERKALEMQRRIFGEIHSDVASSYNSVGSTLSHLGKYEEALENQRKALEMRCKIFGEIHPDVASSYNNVGSTLVKIGKYEEALKDQRQALEMLRKIFGEMHPHVATSYNNVGLTLGYLGKHKEALENQRKALEMRRKIFGEMHPDVAVSYNNIGATLFQQQDYFSAVHQFKKALDIYQSHPCYQLHSNIVTSHNWLTQCYNALNDKKKSSQHTQESKNISRELDNQKAFQKTEVLLMDYLHKKEYRTAYNLLTKLPKYLQEAPQFFCHYLQIALLCPDLNPHVREKRIQTIDNALKKQEGSILTRLKLCVNLASYWLNEKSQNWDKAYECVKHLSQLLEMASTLCFKYEFLDVLAFGDNPLIEGECISAQILCNFIALRIYQGKKNSTIIPIAAKQLLEKVNTCNAQGHKIEEIKNFCLECLKQ